MGNISDVAGNIKKIRQGYRKLLALGEGVAADEFILTVEGYADLRYLIQSTQFPALIRETIESYGPQGVQFNQQGRYKNAQDVPITFKEVIKGTAYKALRDWVKNKKYLEVKIGLAGESFPTSNANTTVTLEDCWIELEGVDLSVEDGGTLVRPSGTLHANWISWLDDDQEGNLSLDG